MRSDVSLPVRAWEPRNTQEPTTFIEGTPRCCMDLDKSPFLCCIGPYDRPSDESMQSVGRKCLRLKQIKQY
jgi:hypothetical protein